jgi:hypothetical protein
MDQAVMTAEDPDDAASVTEALKPFARILMRVVEKALVADDGTCAAVLDSVVAFANGLDMPGEFPHRCCRSRWCPHARA